MENKKNIGGIIVLSVGVLLVVGSVVALIIIKIKNKEDQNNTGETDVLANDPNAIGVVSKSRVSTFSVEQIKAMQTYLLHLGIKYNNQYIIDAIQLTGGIDGKMGSGFRAAVQEAKDKGYLSGYDDILQRLGY